MKQLVYDIKEMSDSKEIYGQRPNPFFSIFIYTIVALLATAVLFCCICKMEIVATAAGVIRPSGDVHTVSCLAGGQVTQVNYSDGQLVKKGDVLLTVDTAQHQIQLDNLETTRQAYMWQLEMLDQFLAGIDTGENPFSREASSKEYSYSVQFESYLLQLKNTDESIAYDAQQTATNIKTLNQQIGELKAQIAGWTSYKESILKGENLAADHPTYENMYLLYTATLNNLKNDYETQRKQIEATTSGQTQAEALAELEKSYLNAKNMEYYQTVIQIDTTLASLQAELNTATASLSQYKIAQEKYENSSNENGQARAVSQVVIEQTAALLNQKDSVQAQLEEVNTQIKQTQEQISQGTVTAQCGGTVSVLQTLAAGDVVASGATVATVIPQNESLYKVQIYVNNADVANIEEGNTVRYNIAALPNNQYETVRGTVTSISTDTMIQDGQYSGFYLVECTIDKNTVKDQKGNTGTITTGMQVEAKIVTQEKTIMRYLLEKIDIFD